MFDGKYYKHFTCDGFVLDNDKSTTLNNIIYLNYKNKYFFIPILDPVHKNHIVIMSKVKIHSAMFYFPSKTLNILKDMIEINNLTSQYVYNSIELGSIPEHVHFHTSNEIPPLNNITAIAKKCISFLSNSNIKCYYLNYNPCIKGYYIEVTNDNIEKFINVLPCLIYN
jgi:hypothetical protein